MTSHTAPRFFRSGGGSEAKRGPKHTPKKKNTMRTTYKAPSAKRLIDALNITPEQADTVRGLIQGTVKTLDPVKFPRSNDYFSSCYRQPKRLGRVLVCLNEILEMHGVESLGPVQTYGPPAEYLNAGNTYAATLIFDHMAGNFKLTTCGDWIEQNENKAAFRNW